MNFHAEFFPKQFDPKIEHHHQLMLMGSCFTEQIGQKLAHHKFRTLDNPNGILFNPISIAKSIESYIACTQYREEDLFYFNESWGSWDHHTRFSDFDKTVALDRINESQRKAHDFLKQADWLLITLGSAFVYERDSVVVANCHKVPTDKFQKRLLSPLEITAVLNQMIKMLVDFNPSLKLIFTISPVRHLREGFIENNRSKANLIQSVHQLTDTNNRIQYFPAYELVIDDLRDYRFYAEDMVHPNYSATNYVWEKFLSTAVSESAQKLMKDIAVINAARAHKPFNPRSEQHQQFLKTHLEKLRLISKEYPYIDFNEAEKYFQQQPG